MLVLEQIFLLNDNFRVKTPAANRKQISPEELVELSPLERDG